MRKISVCAPLGAAILAAGAASGDSIDPESFTGTLAVGESVTLTKTVTIDESAATDAPIDIFFLSDTTGSMGSIIDSVQADAGAILSATDGLGDVQHGVGEYEDYPSFGGGSSDVPFTLHQAITDDDSAVTAGIGKWDDPLGFGGDGPESALTGLKRSAEEGGFRPGSSRFLVWFGDAPGHTPDDYPAGSGFPGPTLAETEAALTGANISVIAVDDGNLDRDGQATAITDATGGALETSSGNIVDLIAGGITTAFDSYTSVGLGLNGFVPGGVDVALGGPVTGDFSRDSAESFTFDVTFTGLAPGTYDFGVDALVDGGRVATELDSITVAAVPLPATLPLFGGALAALGFGARRRRRG